jgi:outer membrane protein OmpA-like peptidoglycan-associated protein
MWFVVAGTAIGIWQGPKVQAEEPKSQPMHTESPKGSDSKPAQTPSMAFENAPGVLATSIRTLRKETVQSYATESLGVVALGLEDIRLSPVNKDGIIELNLDEKIEFAFNSNAIPKKSRRLLDGIGRLLAENPDTKVQILSHTDDQGDAGYNLRLSQRRADAIKDYLIGRGVADTRITAIGRGEDDPFIETGERTPTRVERAKNRRTELLIEPMDILDEEVSGTDQDTEAEPVDSAADSGAAQPQE